MPVVSNGASGDTLLCLAWRQTQVLANPTLPTLRLHDSPEQLTRLRETSAGSLLRVLWRMQMNTQRERHLDKVWKGPECRSFWPQGVGVPHPDPGSWMYSTHKLSEPCRLGVLEVPLSRQDWLNYWPLMTNCLSRPSSQPAGGGGAEGLVPLVTGPHPAAVKPPSLTPVV